MPEGGVPGDASTLIYVAKADAFEDLVDCVAAIVVPPSVWREAVDEGERVGAAEVPPIRDATESGFLRRVELEPAERVRADRIASGYRLGLGESEVLALGHEIGRAIIDEGRAARVAQALGIVPVSTLFLPVLGRQRGTLERGAAVALLRRLAVVIGARAETVFAIEEELRKGPR